MTLLRAKYKPEPARFVLCQIPGSKPRVGVVVGQPRKNVDCFNVVYKGNARATVYSVHKSFCTPIPEDRYNLHP